MSLVELLENTGVDIGRLGRTNNSGLPLNTAFENWNDHVERNLIERSIRKLKNAFRDEFPDLEISDADWNNYAIGEYAEFLAQCQEHANRFNLNTDAPNIIVLVHPFYMELSHSSYVNSKVAKKHAKRYSDNLQRLLNSQRPPNVSLIVIETAHHYASATSSLLEQGIVDRVVFSKFDRGDLVNPEDLQQIGGHTYFLGGGYVAHCLAHSLEEISKVALSNEDIWGISDLILYSPLNCRNILGARYLHGESGDIPSGRMIPLRKVERKLDLAA